MGRIIDRIKARVIANYNDEIDASDQSHAIHPDGLGFTIIRKNGGKLVYNGSDLTYTSTPPTGSIDQQGGQYETA